MGEEEISTAAASAAAPSAAATIVATSTSTRRSGSHLWMYAINFGALVILVSGYIFFAEEENIFASLVRPAMTMTAVNSKSSSSVSGSSSPPSSSLTRTVTNLITSSAAAVMNMRGECKAQTLGYRSMTCPYWNPSARDPLAPSEALDFRIRHMWKRQHPADCSNASYLVKRTTDDVGFGALMRGHYAGPFAGAMRSNRVFMVEPATFPYSGCNDSSWTCYFEPLTNCSYEEHVVPLLEAHPGAREEWLEWTNASHKVVHREGWGAPEYYPSDKLLDDIFKPLAPDELVVGLYLYMMRLNARTLQRVEEWLREIIPCDLDPRRTIALPIRASDKCRGEFRIESGFGGETSCPDFDTYMEFCEAIRENDPQVDTILLTSEDARFVEARHNYTVARGNRKPWRFVVNSRDVMQASGDRKILGNGTMDDVFMSFFTTMQIQMRGKYYVMNCGSNYHGMIRQLVGEGGCGFVPRPIIICMDAQADRFRICPGWNEDEYNDCMDAKLPEPEREVKKQERKRKKEAEEEERKQKEEKEKEDKKEEKKKRKEEEEKAQAAAATTAATAAEKSKDEMRRRLGIELRRLISTIDEKDM